MLLQSALKCKTATQDRLAYGSTFEDALTNLFGEAAKTTAPLQFAAPKAGPSASPQASATPQPTGTPGIQQLVNRAAQEFEDYQKLTAEGKLSEAGKKLEEHKRTLEELKKAAGKP